MNDLRTPLARAHGLGTARGGMRPWWLQRLTAVALLLLGTWFVVSVLLLLRSGFIAAHLMLADPLNAVLMIAFTTALFWHAQIGMQVIIEDYVSTRWLEIVLQVLVLFLAALGALASAVAVLRIALGY